MEDTRLRIRQQHEDLRLQRGDKKNIIGVHAFRVLKRRFSLNSSSSSFVIRVNLVHPSPSVVLYGLLQSFWSFSI